MTDEELVKLFKDGDNPNYAFNLIVRKHQERLYWMINRIVQNHDDSDDVIQNVFIKAWKALPKFREDANLYSWLYRIATNEALTFIKKRKRRGYTVEVDSQFKGTLNTNDPTENEILEKLETAIARLPEKQRLVFHLKYYEEKKYAEISEILDTSVGSLKASYHHAVKKIEQFLTDN
ncbi:MAG TPA: RNA polymerase subunit sigma [Flavobacteriales bacterium]|nr:RNA polymerase subunit sigma [Crocinitomicaceae bacterium]HAE32030.1 RNA polymerase subunit sigma [Flavobacteriales bacterium]